MKFASIYKPTGNPGEYYSSGEWGCLALGAGGKHVPPSLAEATGCSWGHGPQDCLPLLCPGWDMPLHPDASCTPGLVAHQHGRPLNPSLWDKHIETKLKPWGKAGSFCKEAVSGGSQGMELEWFSTIPSPRISLTLPNSLHLTIHTPFCLHLPIPLLCYGLWAPPGFQRSLSKRKSQDGEISRKDGLGGLHALTAPVQHGGCQEEEVINFSPHPFADRGNKTVRLVDTDGSSYMVIFATREKDGKILHMLRLYSMWPAVVNCSEVWGASEGPARPRDRESPSSLLPWVRCRNRAGTTMCSLCGREGALV